MSDPVLLAISTALSDIVELLEEKQEHTSDDKDRIASAIEAMTAAMSSLKAPHVSVKIPDVVVPETKVVVNGSDIEFSFDVDVNYAGQITAIRGKARRI